MSLRVVEPGLLTTIQDRGRWGAQALGVPVAGPMDPWSHRMANRLVGNDEACAGLEVTLSGPMIEWLAPATVAVVGGAFALSVDGARAEPGRAWRLPAGSRLAFGARTAGARAYVAVAGGIDVPLVLGSRSTDLASRLGGLGGRALRRGDRLEIGAGDGPPPLAGRAVPVAPPPRGGASLRVLAAPGWMGGRLSEVGLTGTRFRIATSSNRMGYRLEGATARMAAPGAGLSTATPVGTIQVPPSGAPILLMADRQTTGGYLAPATLISADLGVAGQLGPGDWVELVECDRATAMAALVTCEQAVLRIG